MRDWHSLDWIFSHFVAVAVFAAVVAISSVAWSAVCDNQQVRKWLVAFWSVSPPVWFFFEFHWARATKDEAELKRVRESQELAAKVWAGVVAALSILYLKGSG